MISLYPVRDRRVLRLLKKLKQNWKITSVIAGLVILSATLLSIVYINNKKTNLVDTDTVALCSGNKELLEKIGPLLDLADYKKLQTAKVIVDNEITAKEGFEADFNCIYPAAVVAVGLGQTDIAQGYFDQIDVLPNNSPAEAYYDNFTPIDRLKIQNKAQESINESILESPYDQSIVPVSEQAESDSEESSSNL